jgi:copper(I)-binding protein
MTMTTIPRMGWLGRSAGIALALLLAVGAVQADQTSAPEVSVNNARLRLLPGDLPLAGYCELTNQGSSTEQLVGASSPAFASVMLHRSVRVQGMERMEHVDAVELAPGDTVRFAPGGLHLMLMSRTHALQVGDNVPVTLEFADGRQLTASFRVGGPATE